MSVRSKFVTGIGAITLGLACFSAVAIAANTPSISNGDCWRYGTPLWCRVGWGGTSTAIHFRAINQFWGQPSWSAPIQAAVNAWNSAPGPQYYSFTPYSGDTFVYITDTQAGYHGLNQGDRGITWNCDISRNCVDYQAPMSVWWSDVYLNTYELDTYSKIQHTAAHESGHAMGLWHNSTDSASLMYQPANSSGGPTSADIGNYPGCASGGAGIECVYGWGD